MRQQERLDKERRQETSGTEASLHDLHVGLAGGAPDGEDLAVAGDFDGADADARHQVRHHQQNGARLPRNQNLGDGHHKDENGHKRVLVATSVEQAAAKKGADQVTDGAGRLEPEEAVHGAVGEDGQVEEGGTREAVAEALKNQKVN